MTQSYIFIGLDVHQNFMDVALADDTREGEVRHYGKIGGDLDNLDRLIRRLGYKKDRLRFVYEAGPCGYCIYRYPCVQYQCLSDESHAWLFCWQRSLCSHKARDHWLP